MSIKLNRKGAGLAGEDRVKENQNLEMIEQEFGRLGVAKEDSAAAKLSALEALAKANAADSLSKNVQTQLNTIVVEGDSSPQAEQASVGARGEDYGGNLKARLDAEYNAVTTQLAETVILISPITELLNVPNDGTQDVSIPLRDFALGKEGLYIYFPPGKYRWDNNIKLTNKKIKFFGDNAVIEHYAGGTVLDIGDVVTKNVESFHAQGVDFVNKRPKPATGGSGVTGLQVSDCVNLTLRDMNLYDAEQYGINLRRSNGSIKNAVLDNVKVFGVSGTIGTTTPIALETRASSGDGKIENLKISNSYFEVVDSYLNSEGGTTNISLSNASKLQTVDNLEMVNVVFKGGKENGALTLSHDTRKVKMTNVSCKSDSLASKGLTITLCPNLELLAVNSDLGINNFSQSIGVADTVKEAKFVACKLQRITKVSGDAKNFKFENCTFYLPSLALNISLSESFFTNCTIDVNSPVKDVYLVGNGNKVTNFSGLGIMDISGSDNKVIGGDCESIRPNGTSSNNHLKAIVATSSGRPFRNLTDTTSDYLVEECTFVRTVGGGDSSIVNPRGIRMKFIHNNITQKDKTTSVAYAVFFTNSSDCVFLEKKNEIDVNIGTSKIGQTNTTGLKRYTEGDTFVNGGVPQIWNGTAFVNL